MKALTSTTSSLNSKVVCKNIVDWLKSLEKGSVPMQSVRNQPIHKERKNSRDLYYLFISKKKNIRLFPTITLSTPIDLHLFESCALNRQITHCFLSC